MRRILEKSAQSSAQRGGGHRWPAQPKDGSAADEFLSRIARRTNNSHFLSISLFSTGSERGNRAINCRFKVQHKLSAFGAARQRKNPAGMRQRGLQNPNVLSASRIGSVCERLAGRTFSALSFEDRASTSHAI
jgi:hypothetical protein